MKIARKMMMAAAMTLAATPALAAPAPANPAASLSVAKSVRAATPARRGSKFTHATVVYGVVAALIITGVVLAITLPSDNSTSP